MAAASSLCVTLKRWVKELPDKPFFIFRTLDGGRRVLTYDLVYRLGARWAAVLRKGGHGRGTFVVNTLLDSPERLVCEVATILCGSATVNGICHLADGSDLVACLRQSRATGIFVDPDVTSSPWGPLQKHLTLDNDNNVTSEELPDLKKVYFIRRVDGDAEEDFLTKLETLQDTFEADDVTRDDVCAVFTTSGSTGFSKLVVHTHGSLLRSCEMVLAAKGTDPKSNTDREFSISPLGWVGGYIHQYIVFNATRVLCDFRAGMPDDMPAFITQCVQEEKCVGGNIPPLYTLQILERLKQAEEGTKGGKQGTLTWTHKLNSVFVTGQPITKSMARVAGMLAHVAVLIYASTETIASCMGVITPKDVDNFEETYAGSPMPGAQIRAVSMDQEEKTLPLGERGYLQMKTQWMFREYLNDPETTKASFTADGFFRSGDIGVISPDKRVKVEGRGSDAIMRGNYIFYPTWIEARIRACPLVVDVVVVGVPDPLVNEELCACVVLTSDRVTVEEVRDWVEKDIVGGNDEVLCPKPRHYLPFERLPSSTTGKPNRREIKALATERLQNM